MNPKDTDSSRPEQRYYDSDRKKAVSKIKYPTEAEAALDLFGQPRQIWLTRSVVQQWELVRGPLDHASLEMFSANRRVPVVTTNLHLNAVLYRTSLGIDT